MLALHVTLKIRTLMVLRHIGGYFFIIVCTIWKQLRRRKYKVFGGAVIVCRIIDNILYEDLNNMSLWIVSIYANNLNVLGSHLICFQFVYIFIERLPCEFNKCCRFAFSSVEDCIIHNFSAFMQNWNILLNFNRKSNMQDSNKHNWIFLLDWKQDCK